MTSSLLVVANKLRGISIMKDLRNELRQLKFDLDLIQKDYCSKEEAKQYRKMVKARQSLPDGVKSDETGYFRYVEIDLSKENLDNLILYRQTSYLKSIKNSMIFFVFLTIVSLIISLVIALR